MTKLVTHFLKKIAGHLRHINCACFWSRIQPECPICMSILKENDDGELECNNPLCFMCHRHDHD